MVSGRPKNGYRGYIFSRPIAESRVPQHIQNLVLRDYASRFGLFYKLSATEYVMDGSYLMLEQVLDELPLLDGVILYSIFMLPLDSGKRSSIYQRVLAEGAQLHAAVEGFCLAEAKDVLRWEDIFTIAKTCDDIDYGEIEKWLT
jgi:sporadic carbohydrate cluster protein (TIGR04323 family)